MPRKSSPSRGTPKSRRAPPKAKKSSKRSPKSSSRPRSRAVGRDPSPRRKGRLKRLLFLALFAGLGALAVQTALLWERAGERMDGRPHDEPARITGVVPRLVVGEAATAPGWRDVFARAGWAEVASPSKLHPGSYVMDGGTWTIQPKSGPVLEARIRSRRLERLRERASKRKVPALEVPLPAVSLLTGSSRERRSVTALDDLPQDLVRAVVAIEDERFYKHFGIDPRGIARAAFHNLRRGGVSQGGSTITQQLAKNMFLTSERTASRKLQEALIAGILEVAYDKDRILEAYLNEIYLGQRDGWAILGVAEAARAWFGKSVDALTLGEAALIAGAIHSPNRTVPWRHPEEAKRRRDAVLRKMAELEAAPAAAIESALAAPLPSTKAQGLARTAPWFIDGVVSGLRDRYTPEALHRDGLQLVTTLDPRMQDAAERAVAKTLAALRSEYGERWGTRTPEAALIALDPRDGAVRALVGGADYGRSQFDRARAARRQPGSAFKPIVLAAAIADDWRGMTPARLVEDTPLSVPGAGPRGSDWKPRNHDGKFLGPIPLQVAVERSRNLPFVRLGMDVGLRDVVATAEAMGVTTELRPLPSLSIGAQEVTLLDLAVSYGTLAADGTRPVPRMLEGVRARDGGWLERALPERATGIDPRVARRITAMLQGTVERGTARGLRRAGFELPLAAKTGTSNESRDAWTAAYSPELVVVVWVGFDQGGPLGLASTQAAVPLAGRFLVNVEPLLAGDQFAVGPTAALDVAAIERPPSAPGGPGLALPPAPPKPPKLAPPPPPKPLSPPGKVGRKSGKRSRADLQREDRERRRREAEAAREMGR